MKKTLIILLAIIVFFVPLMQIQQQTAHAAVVGKVISKSAKEIAKEIVADAAFETAGSMALKYAFDDKDGKFKIDPGTKLICLPGGKVGDDCTKPAQIDTDFTKSELKPEIDSQLEKHINNGKHFNKWERFLDWFAPLWAIAFATTILTYAIDSDVRTFFNEVAMDTLYALGILQPVQDSTIQSEIPINQITTPTFTDPETDDGFYYNDNQRFNSRTFDLSNRSLDFKSKMALVHDVYQNTSFPPYLVTFKMNNNEIIVSDKNSSTPRVQINYYTLGSFNAYLKDYQTGVITDLGLKNSTNTTANFSYSNFTLHDSSIIKFPQLDEQTGKYKMELLSKLSNKSLILEFTNLSEQYRPENIQSIGYAYAWRTNTAYYSANNYLIKASAITEIPLPSVEEIAPSLDPMKVTPYTDGAIVTMPSPSTIPYKHSETGEPLHRDETDPNVWRDPAGDPVPEDLIEVGEPEIIKQPDGSHVAVPQPTPSNPTPVPEQITEPLPDTITPEDFEGLSCDTIKKPKFDPLATAVMTSFPFSIPWDIQRIYEALFANVGSERPEFVFKIPGYDQEFPISLNSYFDDWVPFIRSIILLTFDMGLLYAAYRWTKGGGE